jgi:hypothetical protein
MTQSPPLPTPPATQEAADGRSGAWRWTGSVLALALAAASVLALGAPGASAAPRKAKLDLQLERTPVIIRDSYRRLPSIGPRGQMGKNQERGCPFSLSHQQLGDLYVRAGIIHGKPALIKDGFRAFDYAFRKQRDNGSFPADQTEEYGFFVEAVAHSVLLLRGTPYRDDFRRKLKSYEHRLRRAAPHMIAPDAWSGFRQRNRGYTHSAYVVGTALAMTGELTSRSKFKRYGREAIRLGLKRQRKSGMNPELGGPDVRYQMAGIVYAERFRVYFPDGKLKRRVERMVNRGLRWMDGKIDGDGWINPRGSTRACKERSGFCLEGGEKGQVKSPGYDNAIRSFAYWGALKERERLLALARAMQRYERNASDLCGPKESFAAAGQEKRERPRQPGLGRTLPQDEAIDLVE